MSRVCVCLGMCVSRGVCVQEGSPGVCLCVSKDVYIKGVSRVCVSEGVCVQGGVTRGCIPPDPEPDTPP